MPPTPVSRLKPRHHVRHALLGLALAGLVAPAGRAADGAPILDPKAPRDALREIVQDACLVHWQADHVPDPCVRIVLPETGDVAAGYAILKDRKGGAHFLLIPTRTVSGIESPLLLAASGPNYFAAAWDARRELDAVAGRRLERTEVGLAVNGAHARSQDQLHIHIECLQPALRAVLRDEKHLATTAWTPIEVPGWRLSALRIDGATLAGADPFRLLATLMPGAAQAMGDYSLLLAGVDGAAGPGFVLLAGTGQGSELMLDSRCEPP